MKSTAHSDNKHGWCVSWGKKTSCWLAPHPKAVSAQAGRSCGQRAIYIPLNDMQSNLSGSSKIEHQLPAMSKRRVSTPENSVVSSDSPMVAVVFPALPLTVPLKVTCRRPEKPVSDKTTTRTREGASLPGTNPPSRLRRQWWLRPSWNRLLSELTLLTLLFAKLE